MTAWDGSGHYGWRNSTHRNAADPATGGELQCGVSVYATTALRRRIIEPAAPRPMIGIAQVVGSGTQLTAWLRRRVNGLFGPRPKRNNIRGDQGYGWIKFLGQVIASDRALPGGGTPAVDTRGGAGIAL